jgi:pseudaminic acid cytidylyltransferase
MSVVAIIPARGGSKRIPRKNIKEFNGLPMMAHSIRVAREAGLFDRIVVSTDDDEIARVAMDHGAETPFLRPPSLANDTASTEDVLIHALTWLKDHNSWAEYFCCIYATAPFLQAQYLCRGYELLRAQDAVTAFSVTTFPYPIFRSLKINARGRVEMFWPENLNKRSQELPDAYHDAGQFYWGDSMKFLKEPDLIGRDSVPIVMPRYLVQDIDTPEDWTAAELMSGALRMRGPQ